MYAHGIDDTLSSSVCMLSSSGGRCQSIQAVERVCKHAFVVIRGLIKL